jgi:hypothetical protein
METASSISRRRPQTELTPNRGIRSSSDGGFSTSTPASGGHGPDAVRARLCRFPARTSSGDGVSRSLATRNRFIANLRRLRSNAEDATATTAAAVAETAAAAVAAGGGVDLVSSQQFSAIGGKRGYRSPTAARRLHRRVRVPSGQSFSARPPSTTSTPSKFRRETVPSSSLLFLCRQAGRGGRGTKALSLGGSRRGSREKRGRCPSPSRAASQQVQWLRRGPRTRGIWTRGAIPLAATDTWSTSTPAAGPRGRVDVNGDHDAGVIALAPVPRTRGALW